MKPTYLKTKFAPPRLHATTVRRGRILDKLNTQSTRVTIIHAPGGYGKTTLAAQWRGDLIAKGNRIAWLNLDIHDNESLNFLTGLTNALSEAGCEVARDAMNYFKSGVEGSLNAVLTTLSNDIIRLKPEYYLFLDGVQFITEPSLLQALSNFILNSPKNLHFILISRQNSDLALSRLNIENRLTEIDITNMKFSFAEAKDFLKTRCKVFPDTDQLRSLYDATEGWVVALEWAAKMTSKEDNFQILKTPLLGSDGDIASKFLQDVLSDFPKNIQVFLLQTSIVDSFNISLAQAVTGSEDCAGIINYLGRENYFLLPMENEQTWYRYHPLFLSSLRAKLHEAYVDEAHNRAKMLRQKNCVQAKSESLYSTLLRDIGPAQYDKFNLHRRAGDWYRHNGVPENALQHYIHINDQSSVSDLLENSALSLLEDGRVETLVDWAKHLPKTSFLKRPRLTLYMAWAYLLSCRTENADGLIKVMEDQPDTLKDVTEGEIKAIRTAYHNFMDDSRKAAMTMEGWDRKGDAFSIAAGCNGLSFIKSMNCKFDEAREVLAWVEQQPYLQASYFPYIYRQCSIATTYTMEGQFEISNRIAYAALKVAEQRHGRRSASACVTMAVLSDGYYEQNRLQELQELLANRFDVVNETVYPDALIRVYINGAKTYWAIGEKRKSVDLLDRLYSYGESRQYNRVMAASLSEKIQQAITTNQVNRAKALQQRLVKLLPDGEEEISFDTIGELVLLVKLSDVRLKIFLCELDAATDIVNELLRTFEKSRRRRLIAQLSLMRAVIKLKAGQYSVSLEDFVHALTIGENCGLKRLFIDAHLWCNSLLKQFSDSEHLPTKKQAYLEELLGIQDGSTPQIIKDTHKNPRSVLASVPSQNFNLSPKEKEVLGLLEQGLPNKRIALAMNISPETVGWHLKNIFSKLGVNCRYDASNRAKVLNLI